MQSLVAEAGQGIRLIPLLSLLRVPTDHEGAPLIPSPRHQAHRPWIGQITAAGLARTLGVQGQLGFRCELTRDLASNF